MAIVSGYDALNAMYHRAKARGWTSETLGHAIWASDDDDGADKGAHGARFRECMSRAKARTFSMSDVEQLMTLLDDYEPLLAQCRRLGFGEPPRLTFEVQRCELMAAVSSMRERHSAEMAEMEAMLDALELREQSGRHPVVEKARFAVEG